MTNQNTYKIDFKSELGQAVSAYFDRCTEAEKAAREFIRSVEQYGFVPCDDNTEYVAPEDADAGGVMAICLSEANAKACWNLIDHILWDHVETEEEDGKVYWFFPRVTIEMHYMRYDKAVRLKERMSPEWDFVMDREKPSEIKYYLYDDIRRQCLPEDVREMTPKSRTTPAPAMRVALGTKYKIEEKPSNALRVPLPTSKPFSDAVALYKAVKALPTVPANGLALVLGLRTRDDKAKRSDIYVEYRKDSKRRCWLIHTGLVSQHPDFKPTTIEWK